MSRSVSGPPSIRKITSSRAVNAPSLLRRRVCDGCSSAARRSGQNPRIRARVENRLRLGDRVGRVLGPSHGLEHSDVVDEPGRERERVTLGAKDSETALEDRQRLLEPLLRCERRAQREVRRSLRSLRSRALVRGAQPPLRATSDRRLGPLRPRRASGRPMRPRRLTTARAIVQARPTRASHGVALIEIAGVVRLDAEAEADDGSPARRRPFELGRPARVPHPGADVAPRHETSQRGQAGLDRAEAVGQRPLVEPPQQLDRGHRLRRRLALPGQREAPMPRRGEAESPDSAARAETARAMREPWHTD